jgi:hypothetical protein
MNLTSSVIGVSFLAQPGIDERLSACFRVERVGDPPQFTAGGYRTLDDAESFLTGREPLAAEPVR